MKTLLYLQLAIAFSIVFMMDREYDRDFCTGLWLSISVAYMVCFVVSLIKKK
jgi:hypothetical protein